MIGQQTAEEVKLEIGSAFPLDEEVQAEIRGRDLVSGLPKTVVLTSEEVRLALEEPLQAIVDAVKETLDRTPPELASDIMDRGIMLAGGGALLQGLDERLRDETQMPAHLAESPLTCVAVGSGRSLEEFEAIHRSQQEFPKQPAALAPAPPEAPEACTTARWSAAGGRRWPSSSRLSMALLTAYFGESAAACSTPSSAAPRRRSRRSRPAPAARSSRSATSSAGSATPSTPRTRTRSCKEEVEQLRARARPRRRPRRATPAAARIAAAATQDGFPHGTDPLTARVIARSPTVWYSSDPDRQGLRRRRARGPAGDHRRRPGRQGHERHRRHRRGHADHRRRERRLGAGVARRRHGRRQPEVGDPDDLRLEYVAEGTPGDARARPWSPPASVRQGRVAVPARHPDRQVSSAWTTTSVELYQRVHVEPFADLRRMDFVQVLTARRRRGAAGRGDRTVNATPGSLRPRRVDRAGRGGAAALRGSSPHRGSSAATPT